MIDNSERMIVAKRNKKVKSNLVEIDWDDPANAGLTRTEQNGGLDHMQDEAIKAVHDFREANPAPWEFASETYMRIVINVNVNGYRAGDKLTVERSNAFFSGLVKQGIAEEVS